MTSMTQRIAELRDALLGVTDKVYHFRRPARGVTSDYIIWSETAEDSSVWTGNHKAEQSVNVAVDYFTQRELDPVVDDIQEALNAISCGWALDAVQYEDETRLIHYTWSVNV